jgi:hypothetical protein
MSIIITKSFKSKLALEVAVAAQPLLDIIAVTLDPVNLSADGIKALFNGAVEALHGGKKG